MFKLKYTIPLLASFLLINKANAFSEWFRRDDHGCSQVLEAGSKSSFTPMKTNSGIEVGDYDVVSAEKTSQPDIHIIARNDDGQKLDVMIPSDEKEAVYPKAFAGEVIEIRVEYSEKDIPMLEYILETTDGGSFVSMTKGCDGKRASWRRNLHFPRIKMVGNPGDIVEIKAAWLTLGSKDLTLVSSIKIKLVDGTKDAEL